MRSSGVTAVMAAIAVLSAGAGVARADVTLGSTAQPSGSTPGLCFTNADDPSENDIVVQLMSGAAPVLTSTVSNGGPTVAPITFTDDVPAGLKLDSAVAGQGSCAISGQTATCTIEQLGVGQSVAVDVVVTPRARGDYVNDVAVRSAALDPEATNDQAAATLGVTSLAIEGCIVPRLKHAPVRVARAVLKHLGCRVAVIHRRSRGVKAGNVIETRPGPGHYRSGRRVELVVSSGRRR